MSTHRLPSFRNEGWKHLDPDKLVPPTHRTRVLDLSADTPDTLKTVLEEGHSLLGHMMATNPVLQRHTLNSPPNTVHRITLNTNQPQTEHHRLVVKSGHTLILQEQCAPANRWIDICIEPTGQVFHVRQPDPEHQGGSVVTVNVSEGARFEQLNLLDHHQAHRVETHAFLTGSHSRAHLVCLHNATALPTKPVGNGAETLFRVHHKAPETTSLQTVKALLHTASKALFQGKILVDPSAQKTQGYQMGQALMLDDDARFLTKPELEIFADDVKCSHGSTVGGLDPEAVFFCQARGLDPKSTKILLAKAFLTEALDGLHPELIEAGNMWMKTIFNTTTW